MGKLIVTEFVTADGRMGDPGVWTPEYFNEQVQQIKNDEYFSAEALMFGGNTFRTHAAAWPSVTDSFGTRLNAMKKYVVSTTANPTSWTNTEAITANHADRIRQVKTDTVGDILVDGSGQLVNFLLAEGLVDQINLLVFPELFGEGPHLFRDGAKQKLTVTTCTLLTGGAVHLRYTKRQD